MSDSDPSPTPRPRPSPAASRIGKRRTVAAAALIGAFAIGVGATSMVQHGRRATLIALTPAPITEMKDWTPVAVKGEVAEIFGNKFILQDESGRALVETGREGEGGKLVAKSETITVQGRFEHGFIHAMAIAHADGRSDLLGPPGPPPHAGLLSWRDGGLFHGFGWHPSRNG